MTQTTITPTTITPTTITPTETLAYVTVKGDSYNVVVMHNGKPREKSGNLQSPVQRIILKGIIAGYNLQNIFDGLTVPDEFDEMWILSTDLKQDFTGQPADTVNTVDTVDTVDTVEQDADLELA